MNETNSRYFQIVRADDLAAIFQMISNHPILSGGGVIERERLEWLKECLQGQKTPFATPVFVSAMP